VVLLDQFRKLFVGRAEHIAHHRARIALAGAATRWVSPGFVVGMFLVTSLGIAIFGASPLYPGLIMGAFVFGFGNVATTIGNATLSMASAPKEMVGRLMASRQVFIAFGKVVGLLVFGRLAGLPSEGTAPYPVMVFAGMLPWFLFSTILSEASSSLVGKAKQRPNDAGA